MSRSFYKVLPNNTVAFGDQRIPFDLVAEACKVVASEDKSEGVGCFETPRLMVFLHIAVIPKEYIIRFSNTFSFRHIRN